MLNIDIEVFFYVYLTYEYFKIDPKRDETHAKPCKKVTLSLAILCLGRQPAFD